MHEITKILSKVWILRFGEKIQNITNGSNFDNTGIAGIH